MVLRLKKYLVLILCSCLCGTLRGQMAGDTLQARIVLIGDAGEFDDHGNHPVVAAVKKHIPLDAKTVVIYLGDNLYSAGLPDEQYLTYNKLRAVLDTQANIANGTPARVYFIPGNHDWNEFGEGGLEAVLRQQRYIESLGNDNVQFYPGDGCPGPVKVTVSNDVMMVMIDSQWWLHAYEKPGIESDCPYKTRLEVINEINNLLDQNADKLVILATHHPLESHGIHGGYFGIKQAIFPLTDLRKNLYIPIPFGFIYPIARGIFGTPQDMKHPEYANMINELKEAVRPHKNVIFVAGHEHNQQLIRDSGYYFIVSGAGAKQARVSTGKNSLFASDTTGFAVLEVSTNKNVVATFYNVSGDKTEAAYAAPLLNFSTLQQQDPFRITYIPYNADSITIAANPLYNRASALKRFFNGNNYRREWATPVKMKIFYLNKQGMTIESMGGGNQTKNLTLKDRSGKEWKLRTVDKDLDKVLPNDFRGETGENYIRDFVSSAHPYAPLVVPPLAKAAGVAAAQPKLYFVPNDNALGLYRPLFANKVVMLEEKEPTPDGSNARSTAKTLANVLDNNNHTVQQHAVLRARLLDVLIGDWDRHFDQWQFGQTDTGKGKLYYPIPRDRDQALANSNGLVVKLLSFNKMPYLHGFKKSIGSFKWQSYFARDFDRLFLNSLDRQQWTQQVTRFQQSITDSVIQQAVRQLPPAIYVIGGPAIEQKLRQRRNALAKASLRYYKQLAREVTVRGSNDREFFRISDAGNRHIQVKVYQRNRGADTSAIMYSRTFNPRETKEIRFFGLRRDDIFWVDSNVNSTIRLRLIGGKGDDTFNVRGNLPNTIYDFDQDDNFVINGNRSNIRITNNLEANNYSPTGHQYNHTHFPIANLGYNQDDGMIAALGARSRKYGFRKEPYASDQRFDAWYAFAHQALRLHYTGDFTSVVANKGFLINAAFVTPVNNNYYGLGSTTTIDKDRPVDFYRVRYNYVTAEAFVSRRVVRKQILFGIGPHIFHYWNHASDNRGKVLERPAVIGLDSASVYQTKTWAGIKAIMNINTLNNDVYPTRGVAWNSQLSVLPGVRNSNTFSLLTTDLTLYSSFTSRARFVNVLRGGFGRIFTNNYEFFQALNLGQNNFLRGYRKNRFAGSTRWYVGEEARFKLADSKNYVLPGTLGLLVFADAGWVWTQSDTRRKMHYSYGGGLFYMPYNQMLISATTAFSPEESLINFSIGSIFNLNF